jgi:hypothetical protein
MVLRMIIDLGTPLNVISTILDSIIKDVVVFEDTLPDVGTYFYNNSKRRIATMEKKCQIPLEESTEPLLDIGFNASHEFCNMG